MNKIYKFILCNAIFLILLLLVYTTHVYFFRVDVIFYSAILDGVIATLISILIIIIINKFLNFNFLENFQLIIIWFLLGYIHAITLPTIIDRSLSLYFLEKINQQGGGIKILKLNDLFTNEYVREYRLIDVRVTEQMESGTIYLENECVKLTKKGQLIVKIGEFYRDNMLAKKRKLLNDYSDALTHPFLESKDLMDYQCH